MDCDYVQGQNLSEEQSRDLEWMSNRSYSCEDIQFELDPKGRKLMYTIVGPAMILFTCLAVFANLTVLISCRWLRRPISKNLLLCLSLTLADTWTSALFFIALVFMSYLPVVAEVDHRSWQCVFLVIEVCRQGGMITSAAHLSALSLNHYLGIVYPLKMKRHMTSGKLFACILLLWISPALSMFLISCAREGQGFRSHENCGNVRYFKEPTVLAGRAFLFCASATITCLLYWRIVVNLSVRRRDPLLQANKASQKQAQQNSKFVITMVLFVGTFIAGWVPYNVAAILICSNQKKFCAFKIAPRTEFFIRTVENSLIIAKLFVNALIYSSRLVEVRYALWRLSQFVGIVGKNAQVPAELERQTAFGASSMRRPNTDNGTRESTMRTRRAKSERHAVHRENRKAHHSVESLVML